MFSNPLMTQDDISIFEKFESTIQSGISDFQESAKPQNKIKAKENIKVTDNNDEKSH